MADETTNTIENRYESPVAWREVDDYFTNSLVREDEALVEARLSGARTTMPNAEVAANQGALLSLIAQTCDAKRILEFGTLAGYSTIWFARAVGPAGHVTTLELEERNAEVAHDCLVRAGVMDRVEIVIGSAAESARRLIESG